MPNEGSDGVSISLIRGNDAKAHPGPNRDPTCAAAFNAHPYLRGVRRAQPTFAAVGRIATHHGRGSTACSCSVGMALCTTAKNGGWVLSAAM
jgi:hypothetical protein